MMYEPSRLYCKGQNDRWGRTNSLDRLSSEKKKKRKDHASWRHFDEKPSIIPGCPVATSVSANIE